MTTRAATKPAKVVHILGRAQFKANGLVLYRVQSGENRYDVTVAMGRVTCCVDQDGNNCKGWMYRRSCHHADLVTAKEAERVALEHRIDQDLQQHIEDELPRLSREEYTAEFGIYSE